VPTHLDFGFVRLALLGRRQIGFASQRQLAQRRR
jgi:hypothetical protein